MKIRSFITKVLYFGSFISALSGIYMIISDAEGYGFTAPFFYIWTASVFGCCLVLEITARRTSLSPLPVIIISAAFILQSVLIFVFCPLGYSIVGYAFVLIMWGLVYVKVYTVYTEGFKPEQAVNSFDANAVIVLFCALVVSVKGLSSAGLVITVGGCATALAALLLSRTSPEKGRKAAGIKGAVMLWAMVAAFAGAAYAVIRYSGKTIKLAVDALVSAFLAIIRFVFKLVDAFFRFLSSLFPEPEFVGAAPEPDASGLGAIPEFGETPDVLTPLLYSILAFMAIAATATVVYLLLRGVKLRLPSGYAGGGVSRSKIRREPLLRNKFKAFRQYFAYKINSVMYRNSARGAFAELEAAYSLKHCGRACEETCREFINRVASEHPNAKDELELLASALDNELYGSGAVYGKEDRLRLKALIKQS